MVYILGNLVARATGYNIIDGEVFVWGILSLLPP
jgi:hypothetical protein